MNHYNDIRSDLKTGDVILFSGRGLISWGIRKFTKSPYSHIGMVVRIDGWDLLMCWESTTLSDVADIDSGKNVNGVQIVPLSERVNRFKGRVVYRRLIHPVIESDMIKLMALRKTLIGRPYEKNKWDLIRSALSPFGMVEDLSSIFCSELVAYSKQTLGILPTPSHIPFIPPADAYVPADWGEKTVRYDFMKDLYGPEILIKE